LFYINVSDKDRNAIALIRLWRDSMKGGNIPSLILLETFLDPYLERNSRYVL